MHRRAILIVVGLLLFACGPSRSELTIHNRTEVPISFGTLGPTQTVPACESITFTWSGHWSRVSPVPEATEIPADAHLVDIDVLPPPDAAIGQVEVVIAPDAITIGKPGELPPCGGFPPTPRPPSG